MRKLASAVLASSMASPVKACQAQAVARHASLEQIRVEKAGSDHWHHREEEKKACYYSARDDL